MFGKRPDAKERLVHVKIMDGTHEEIRNIGSILNNLDDLSAFRFMVTNETVDLVSLGKLIEDIKGLAEKSDE